MISIIGRVGQGCKNIPLLRNIGNFVYRSIFGTQRTSQAAATGIALAEEKALLRFPENPSDLLKDVPRNAKGTIYANENFRIRPEMHSLKTGETYNPRHHGQHYHLECKRNINDGWKPSNIVKLKPPGYTPGSGTGFLPGELFPGQQR